MNKIYEAIMLMLFAAFSLVAAIIIGTPLVWVIITLLDYMGFLKYLEW